MEIAQGVIQEFNENGKAIIIADIPNINRALFRKYKNVLIGFSDGRKISAKQMRKIYVLLKYIAEWIGDTEENTKALMKIQFNMQIQSVGKHIISFRDCDMTTAREFISLLINFMIENEIYSGEPLYLLNDDIEKYIYACLINKNVVYVAIVLNYIMLNVLAWAEIEIVFIKLVWRYFHYVLFITMNVIKCRNINLIKISS